MRLLLALLLSAASLGCTTSQDQSAENDANLSEAERNVRMFDDALAACKPAAMQDWIGEPYSEAMKNAAYNDAGAKEVRVIRPGDPVSMDYLTGRINIELDRQDRAVRFRCG